MEKWKYTHITDLYEVSNHGRVRRVDTQHILRPKLDKYGYPALGLSVRGKKIHTTVHRLVAHAWVDEWKKGLQVNHKDGDKKNNHHLNLEWATPSENIIHSYKANLNANRSKVRLINIKDHTEATFHSLKSLSKHLNMYTSTLIPFIKNSHMFPIFETYVIELENLDELGNLANTKNFGIPVFVFDEALQTVIEFPSESVAAYHTGIRGLGGRVGCGVFTRLGYYVSRNKNSLPTHTSVNLEELMESRYRYWSEPYRPRDHTYSVYDYYTSRETSFNDTGGVVAYLNGKGLVSDVDKKSVNMAIATGVKKGRSGLIRGYGIRTSRHNFPWYQYWEEVIITNRLNVTAVPVHRITTDTEVKLVVGKSELLDALSVSGDELNRQSKLSCSKIIGCITDPNLTVTRLNKPISQDEDMVSSAVKAAAARNGAGGG